MPLIFIFFSHLPKIYVYALPLCKPMIKLISNLAFTCIIRGWTFYLVKLIGFLPSLLSSTTNLIWKGDIVISCLTGLKVAASVSDDSISLSFVSLKIFFCCVIELVSCCFLTFKLDIFVPNLIFLWSLIGSLATCLGDSDECWIWGVSSCGQVKQKYFSNKNCQFLIHMYIRIINR